MLGSCVCERERQKQARGGVRKGGREGGREREREREGRRGVGGGRERRDDAPPKIYVYIHLYTYSR
jgi:hypothetical protein